MFLFRFRTTPAFLPPGVTRLTPTLLFPLTPLANSSSSSQAMPARLLCSKATLATQALSSTSRTA